MINLTNLTKVKKSLTESCGITAMYPHYRHSGQIHRKGKARAN